MKGLVALSLLAAAVPLGAQRVAPGNTGKADRVFVGGRVWTGEPGKGTAEALAVRGSTILKVGSSTEIRALAGKGTDVVELRGRFVAPGFVDAHVHLLGGGLSLDELRLDDAFDFATVAARIGAWAKAHPEARWVTGEGWSYAAFPGGLPSRGSSTRSFPTARRTSRPTTATRAGPTPRRCASRRSRAGRRTRPAARS